MTHGSELWYVARACGIVAWALISCSVTVGLAVSSRIVALPRRSGEMHRFLGLLALVFVAVHIVAVASDGYVHFSVAAILVPFSSAWHPLAVAFGITALYAILAVAVTSLLAAHLSRRLWRAVHSISVLAYLLATAHLLTAGSDRDNPVVLALALGSAILVAFLAGVWAVQRRDRRKSAA